MARMHSRARGKSGSNKPVTTKIPSWLSYKPKEIELLIAKLRKEGRTSAQIGLYLRDNYGIPDVQLITKKKITKILNEKKLGSEIPEDLRALIKKAALIRKHLEDNKQDCPAKRGLQLTESKVMRLVKYYKGANKLAIEWKYDPKKASTYLD